MIPRYTYLLMEEAVAVLDRLKETRYEWGPCPYGMETAHVVSAFSCESLDAGIYEVALADGWRRRADAEPGDPSEFKLRQQAAHTRE